MCVCFLQCFRSNVTHTHILVLLPSTSPSLSLQDSLEVAKRVKEMYSYVCPDLAKEFAKFDAKPDKYFKTFQGIKVSESEGRKGLLLVMGARL